MVTLIKQGLQPINNFFYPQICRACGLQLSGKQDVICIKCNYRLPKTNMHENIVNPMTERFWGRVEVRFAAAFYYYGRSGLVRPLIHRLKYQNQPEIGIKIGQMYGNILRENLYFNEIDTIVPVPMHPSKLRLRGYNQAERFGAGLAETMQKPMLEDALVRVVATESQTRKGRMDRTGVSESVYGLHQNPPDIAGKHILLVDDVFTTGATLEGCAAALLAIPNVTVSIATIATGK